MDRGDSKSILSLGERAMAAGRRYAEMTGRSHALIHHPAEIANHPEFDMLAVIPEDITPDLLHLLYQDGQKSAPGLLPVPSAEAIPDRLLQARHPGNFASERSFRWVDYLPNLLIKKAVMEDRECHGALQDMDDLRGVLRSGADILSYMGHSDGLDIASAASILCSAREEDLTDDVASESCSCLRTHICHRRNRPTAEIIRSRDTLRPEDICATVVLLLTCYGLPTRCGPVPFTHGIVAGLLRNESVGAIVTTWSAATITPSSREVPARILASGRTLGEAIATANRAPTIVRSGTKLCLLGDPRLRANATLRPVEKTPRSIWKTYYRNAFEQTRRVSRDIRAAAANVNLWVETPGLFLQLFLRCGKEGLEPKVMAHLERAEQAVQTWLVKPTEDNLRARNTLLLKYLGARGGVHSTVWRKLCNRGIAARSEQHCPVCGSGLHEDRYTAKLSNRPFRTILTCQCCESSFDLPHGCVTSGIELAPSGRLTIGEFWRQADAAAILSETQLKALRVWKMWGTGDGKLVASADFHIPTVDIPIFVVAFFVFGDSFAVVRLASRALAGRLIPFHRSVGAAAVSRELPSSSALTPAPSASPETGILECLAASKEEDLSYV